MIHLGKQQLIAAVSAMTCIFTLMISGTAFCTTEEEEEVLADIAEPQSPPGTPRGATPIEIPNIAPPQSPAGTPRGDLPIPIQKVTEPQSSPDERAKEKGIILQRDTVEPTTQHPIPEPPPREIRR